MDGSGNVIIEFGSRRYHILYVGIHGSSGMGAAYPYNGRYYLVAPLFWQKEKANYCMVHDSILPAAWERYNKNGVCLLEEANCPGRITPEVLQACLARLQPGVLAAYGEEHVL